MLPNVAICLLMTDYLAGLLFVTDRICVAKQGGGGGCDQRTFHPENRVLELSAFCTALEIF